MKIVFSQCVTFSFIVRFVSLKQWCHLDPVVLATVTGVGTAGPIYTSSQRARRCISSPVSSCCITSTTARSATIANTQTASAGQYDELQSHQQMEFSITSAFFVSKNLVFLCGYRFSETVHSLVLAKFLLFIWSCQCGEICCLADNAVRTTNVTLYRLCFIWLHQIYIVCAQDVLDVSEPRLSAASL